MSLRKLLHHFTRDWGPTRDPPSEKQEVLTTEQIGPKRFKTPEGFLLCQDVPIARAGMMIYGPGEVPVEVGKDGLAYVSRSAEELFRPECLASFVGKPVVDDHPEDDVTPDNWSKLAKGVVLNARPGTGADADVILADLLISDAKMIRDIEAMKREVSAGYEADYEQTGEGQGVQTNIIGNHVALVERGRCGPRCAIGDQSHFTSRKSSMATQTTKGRGGNQPPQRRRISQATLDALIQELQPDASTMDEGETGGPSDSHTHIHIHGMGSTATAGQGAGAVDVKDDAGGAGAGAKPPATDPALEARFASLENGHKEIIAQLAAITAKLAGNGGSGGNDPSGGKTGDEDKDEEDMTEDENPFATKKDDESEEKKDPKSKTNDSAALETSYRDVLAGCEVLVPGFRMPTFDAKAKRSATIDTMCGARRKALDAFGATTEGQRVLESVSGVSSVNTAGLDCPAVATLFRAAVGAKKLLNNGSATQDASRLPTQAAKLGQKAPASLAELNKMYREHYATKH